MARMGLVLRMTVCLAFTSVGAVGTLDAQPAAKRPVIEKSPLLNEPKSPEEMFGAAILMVDLARLDLAAKYLDQFLAAEPDEAMLLQLRDKFGTGDFLKLAATTELQPASTDLLTQLNLAARKQAQDPAFVDGLIQRLVHNPNERDRVIAELKNAGAGVVPEMLRQMATKEMADDQDTFVIALTRMGKQVIPPLIGALDWPEDRIRAAVVDTLGWLDATEAIPYLWFPAFDENQEPGVRDAARRTIIKLLKGSPDRGAQLSSVFASNELKRLSRMLYRDSTLLPLDEQGGVGLWAWDDDARSIVFRSLPPDVASLFLSTRFARQSLALSPEQPEPQRQYLASLLGLEVLRQGWDKPRVANPGSAMYLGLTAGEETVSKVLGEALEAGRASTSVAALEILSQIGSKEQLLDQRTLKSPVLAALNSPDPRVQFAAAVTILKLDPKTGFSGSNRIVSIMARALTAGQRSKAIVIDSDSRRASVTAGFLSESGVEGVFATSGRDGFEQAALSTGVDVIAIHVNCQQWDLTQTLANLRADSRTASIPIVIYGPAYLRPELARVVARNAPATFVTESSTDRDFMDQVVPFMKSVTTPPLSPQEQAQQKGAAAYWLATIASGNLSRIFDVSQAEGELAAAVEDPTVATNALMALAGINTPAGQRRLAEIALNTQFDDNVRQTAANQLAYHIQNHGLLLTKEQVIDVHSGWKSAESPAVKTALAGVIGSLRPNATIVGERLRQFPTQPAN